MKVSVCAKIVYEYEVDVPDEITSNDEIITYCDNDDPVLNKIGTILYNNNIYPDCALVSVIREDTDEILYEGD